MKIIIIISSISVLITIWTEQVHSANMDYRYKPRGPPRPPRQPPQLPPYLKKWEQNRPHRNQVRPPRPIPLELPSIQNFVQPQVQPVLLGPAIINQQIPIRNVWQNQIQQQTQYKPKPEKPFQFSAPITTTHEYDYQIQTNNIPTHVVPIKQVGEKGPIHTIPAPNLSPADRPAIIEEYKRPSYNYIQQQNTPSSSHQYQVTESNEMVKTAQKNVRDQQVYFSNSQAFPQQLYNNVAETQSFGTSSGANDAVLSQQELYQLINSHLNLKQSDQKQIYNNYDVSGLSQGSVNLQPTELSLADYKAMIGQSQPVPSNNQYLKELQQSLANQNIYNNNQMFNYERHAPNGDQLLDNFANAGDLQTQQEPFIQEILDLNQEIGDSNNRAESKSDVQNNLSEGSVYYTNLPNRQAAETLASLQNAGSVNIKKFEDHGSLNIYVPDSQQFSNFEVSSSIRHNDNSNAENENSHNANDVQEEINETAHQQNQRAFGRRTKPKHQNNE